MACTAKFEKEMNDFKKTLELVDDYNAIRLKLTAEMADNSGTYSRFECVTQICKHIVVCSFFDCCCYYLRCMNIDFVSCVGGNFSRLCFQEW